MPRICQVGWVDLGTLFLIPRSMAEEAGGRWDVGLRAKPRSDQLSLRSATL